MAQRPFAALLRKLVVAGVVVATAGLLVVVLWRLDAAPRTDDAYAYADTLNITPQVSGNIVALPVHENQLVRAGDTLFRIDPRPYQDVLDRERASMVQLDQQIMLLQRSVDAQRLSAQASGAAVERAKATARQARDTLTRNIPLVSKGYVSADALDQLRTAERNASADLAVAQLQARQAFAGISGVDALVAQRAVIAAQIASAELNLEYTQIKAPVAGRVVGLTTTNGQYAAAGQSLFNLIDTENWYVVANFRETELEHIVPGDTATVYLMSNPGQRFTGSVISVGFGVYPDDGGAKVAGLPKVERSINWVRVAQRFPVRILVDRPNPAMFRLGASAVAVVSTRAQSAR